MTLAKAAPPDWATWLANATGMPVETVRQKLEMGRRNARLGGSGHAAHNNIKRPEPRRGERLNPGLATAPLGRGKR